MGVYLVTTDSGVALGGSGRGLGVGVDVEELLGLDTSTSGFRIDGGWRFTRNLRHSLVFGWFGLRRDGENQVLDPIEVPPELGENQKCTPLIQRRAQK